MTGTSPGVLGEEVAQLEHLALGDRGVERQVRLREAARGVESDDLLDGDLDLAAALPRLTLDQDHGLVRDEMAELLELVGEERHRQAPLQIFPGRSGP